MKNTLTAMWRLFHAIFFYPILIGLFIWLYIKGAHWIWGLAVIALILIFDPMWRIMGSSFLRFIRTPKN